MYCYSSFTYSTIPINQSFSYRGQIPNLFQSFNYQNIYTGGTGKLGLMDYKITFYKAKTYFIY